MAADRVEAMVASAGSVRHAFTAARIDGDRLPIERAVAIERPVAIEFNGIGYAVMMATPLDLEDFVTGFALGERLITDASDILDIDRHSRAEGEIVRVTVPESAAETLLARVRHRASETSCGLCGIENLEQALRPLPNLDFQPRADDGAIFAALTRLRDHQPLNRATGAVHAAALCSADGRIVMAREDVGRHNAFDKLIGAMQRQRLGWDGGFALLTSRCSYELVEKAALSGCPMLVTVSAATDLAIARANEAGLHLVVLARSDAVLVATGA